MASETQLDIDFNDFSVSGSILHAGFTPISNDEVLRALKSLSSGRSSPDIVSVDVMKCFAGVLVDPLQRLFNYCMERGQLPEQFKGGIICPIYKNKGAWTSTTSYRPVCLTSTVSKLMNRVLLTRLGFIDTPQAQFAGKGGSTDFPLTCVSCLVQFARLHNVGLSLLFVDVSQAFDKTLRPLVLGLRELNTGDASEDDFMSGGASYHQALRMMEFFAVHLPLLVEWGVPQEILALLRSSNSDTWLRLLDRHGARFIRTTIGFRQGCVLASWLFMAYYALVAKEIHNRMSAEGILMEFPCPQNDCRFKVEDAEGTVAIATLSYVDDLLAPQLASDPQELICRTACMTRIVLAVLRDFDLPVNMSKNKTELSICLR
eukprot:6459658-Amphidinium_carterae.1